MSVTLTFTPMEHATLISLVALGIAVMQNDEAEAVLAKLVEPLTDGASAPALHLEL